MIILRSPKGWTGPATVDGKQAEGSFRSHQVPIADMDRPATSPCWNNGCAATGRRTLFDAQRQAARRPRRTGAGRRRAA